MVELLWSEDEHIEAALLSTGLQQLGLEGVDVDRRAQRFDFDSKWPEVRPQPSSDLRDEGSCRRNVSNPRVLCGRELEGLEDSELRECRLAARGVGI